MSRKLNDVSAPPTAASTPRARGPRRARRRRPSGARENRGPNPVVQPTFARTLARKSCARPTIIPMSELTATHE